MCLKQVAATLSKGEVMVMTDEDKSKVNDQDKNDKPDVEEVKDV